MRVYSIISYLDQSTLYEGNFPSFKTCLESAVADKTCLTGADLRHQDLSNANLDDAILARVDLTGSNLSGANLSESILAGSKLYSTCLYNTCLAYSNLQGCDFRHAGFGATDVTGTTLSYSLFSPHACAALEFVRAAQMNGCMLEIHGERAPARFSIPPVVLSGVFTRPVAFLEDSLLFGERLIPFAKCERPDFLKFISFYMPEQNRIIRKTG